MKKTIIQLLLAAVIVALVYWIYSLIATPINFDQDKKVREAAVIERIKDIRLAERQFKSKNQRFTSNFDTLIEFVLTGTMEGERKIVDEDDSIALAVLKKLNKKNVEKFTYSVKDSLFKNRSAEEIQNMRYIPYTNHQTEYILEAGIITTESKVVIATVECRAPYKSFLDTVAYRQEVINLIDEQVNNYNKYPGIKFGSMEGGNNEAGNWE